MIFLYYLLTSYNILVPYIKLALKRFLDSVRRFKFFYLFYNKVQIWTSWVKNGLFKIKKMPIL